MSGILRKYRVNTTARGIDFFLDPPPAGTPVFDVTSPAAGSDRLLLRRGCGV